MRAENLWIGIAEVRPTDECDLQELEGAAGAFVTVLALAETREEFEAAVESELDLHGLEIVTFEDAELLYERLDSSAELLELAFEAASSRELRLQFNTFAEEGEDDDDIAVLRLAYGGDEPVEFGLVGSDSGVLGFVVGVADDWVLVHVIDPTLIVLDGYAAVRLDQAMDVRIATDEDFFARRALEMRGERPVEPDVPLEDARSILASVRESFPIVSVEERGRPERRAVGRIERLDDDAVVLRLITPAGRWAETHRHDYDAIVRVDFGRRYEQTLAWLTALEAPGKS